MLKIQTEPLFGTNDQSTLDGISEIAVCITADWPNFGDRMGFHLLGRLVPPHVPYVLYDLERVLNGGYPDAGRSQRQRLLLLFIGTSVFAPLLNENLIRFVASFPYSIGLFGTQYREQLTEQRGLFDRFVQSLTLWGARYSDDFAWAGRPSNAIHFGDCLIDLWPLTYPSVTDRDLIIRPKIRQRTYALDRYSRRIQSYATVRSGRLHPLLCALTSARQVAYREQREYDGSHASGKFSSMLRDIFGRSYDEDVLFEVNRPAVVEYKRLVSANLKRLYTTIEKLFPEETYYRR